VTYRKRATPDFTPRSTLHAPESWQINSAADAIPRCCRYGRYFPVMTPGFFAIFLPEIARYLARLL
jgi:hypothetical protein